MKKRIYYIINNRFPTIKAHGIQIAKTCEGLARVGFDVALIAPKRGLPREMNNSDPFSFYRVNKNFNITYLPSFDFTIGGFLGKLLFIFQQTLFAFTVTLKMLNKKGIVYSRDPFILSSLLFFSGPLYWEIHRMPSNPRSWLYGRLIKKVTGIIAISHGIANELEKYGVPRKKILVSPDGVDIQLFSKNASKEKSKIIMYVGHLFKWKGVDTLVAAANLLTDFQIMIVGGTKFDRARLEKIAGFNKVIFIDYKPHYEMPSYLSKADILVLPNSKDGGLSEFYTSPLKLFEYMASGKPIIASDLPSLREILNERNSVLIEPDNPEALAMAVIMLEKNEEFSENIASQAFKDVQQYSWENRAQSIKQFIEK